MKPCSDCGKEIQDEARICRHCRKSQTLKGTALLGNLKAHARLGFGGGLGKSMGIFMAANAAILFSLLIVVGLIDPGGGILAGFLVLLLGFSVPFVMLLLSKKIVKWSYSLKSIDPANPADEQERFLLELVTTLADRASLPQVPEVCIYKSDEPNAFATGPSKSDSLIAFSSGLLAKLDVEEIAAVAAHETAHIANGDMLTMALLEGLINAVVIAFDFALRQSDWYDEMREKSKLLAAIVHFILVNILLIAGNLVLLWFSRHREFEADATAARLVSADAMSRALQRLSEDEALGSVTEAGNPAAAMMIIAPSAWTDLFSTHPATERRINHLQATFGEGRW